MYISDHAIERFRERTGCKKQTNQIISKLKKMVTSAKEIYLDFTNPKNIKRYKPNSKKKLLFYEGFFFVVKEDTLVTVFNTSMKNYV